jgi:hypothetical protein
MISRTLFILFTFCCLCLTHMARGEEEAWKHVQFVSKEGVSIQLDYQPVESRSLHCIICSTYYYANPLWISVSHPLLRPSDKIRVVLLNFSKHTGMLNEKLVVGEFDLKHGAAGIFNKQLPALSIQRLDPEGEESYRQELAVVINGRWLKNSIDNSSNFGFKLK